MKNWNGKLFLYSLIAMLIGYHAVNLSREYQAKGWIWKKSPIEISAFGSDWHIPMVSQKQVVLGKPVDFASRAVGEWGYVLKYIAAQFPESLFWKTVEDSVYRIYLRAEIIFQFAAVKPEVERRIVPHLKKVVAHYTTKGVSVAIVPVPTKISIERSRLGEKLPPESWWNPFPIRFMPEEARAIYQMWIDAAPRNVVDLYRAYTHYQASGKTEDLYAPHDSHWTSLGIGLAAGEVAKWAGRNPPQLREEGLLDDLEYDFWLQLQLPGWFTRSSRFFPWKEVAYRAEGRSGPSRGRLILVGTSYGERLSKTPYGLGSQLARCLDRELVDAARSHFGPNGGFQMLTDEGFRFKKGDLLVWEVPVREIFKPGEDVVLLPVSAE